MPGLLAIPAEWEAAPLILTQDDIRGGVRHCTTFAPWTEHHTREGVQLKTFPQSDVPVQYVSHYDETHIRKVQYLLKNSSGRTVFR
jgi:hypothetical protein